MATRKNEHKSKWAIMGQMGTLGPMDIRASGHWGQMGIGGKWPQGKMSARANGHWGK